MPHKQSTSLVAGWLGRFTGIMAWTVVMSCILSTLQISRSDATLLAAETIKPNTAVTKVPTRIAAGPTATSTPRPTDQALIYTVRSGDTVSTIAESFGVSADAIVEANSLHDPDRIWMGQRLLIPVTDETPDSASEGSSWPTETPIRGAATAVAATPTRLALPTPTTSATISTATEALTQPILPNRAMSLTPGRDAPPPQGRHYVCPANATVYRLDLPADPIRLLVANGDLYLIADGDLYVLAPPAGNGAQPIAPEKLTPPDRLIGRYEIRELVSVALEPDSGDLLLLDKTNDVYRYSTAGQWDMAFPATPIPGQFPDPQFLAVQSSGGDVYTLDSDLSHIWRLEPQSGLPLPHWEDQRLLTALDMQAVQVDEGAPTFFLLSRDGSLARLEQGEFTTLWTQPSLPDRARWPGHIFVNGNQIGVVESQARTVTLLDQETGEIASEIEFRLPAMGRLRSAVVDGQVLYGIAGRNLYVVNLGVEASCAPAAFDDTYSYQGIDLQELFSSVGPPFPGTTLPDRPRSYPGARRLYRYGIHEGVDLYGTDAPGVRIGSPVRSIAAGTVTRVDADYIEMSPTEYEAAIDRTMREHRTPTDLTDGFLGRQVHVDHGQGAESRYGHLGNVASSLVPGSEVEKGDPVGVVGVSGTSAGAYGTADGAHLHFEIWIDNRYLGQGLTLYETMRLWQAIFDNQG